MHDIKVDTRELYTFDNILEFINDLVGRNYTYPRARVALLLLDIHGEVCWHCSDRKHVAEVHKLTDGQFRDTFVLTSHGKCPRCGRTMYDMIREKLWTAPSTACLMLGQRSGKSWPLAFSMLYTEYKLQVLERDGVRVTPSQYYYGREDLQLVCSVVGSKLERDTMLGSYMYGLRNSSKWFKLYFEIMDMYAAKHGMPFYEHSKHGARYHNNVHVYGEQAESVVKLRGKTRFATVLPEVSWTTDTKGNVIDMHKQVEALRNGHKTMWNAFVQSVSVDRTAPLPLLFMTTTPRDSSDVASTMEKQSYFDRSIYFAKYPTWEVNPEFCREELMSLKISEATKLRDFACVI